MNTRDGGFTRWRQWKLSRRWHRDSDIVARNQLPPLEALEGSADIDAVAGSGGRSGATSSRQQRLLNCGKL